MLVSQPPPPSLGYVRYDDVDRWFRESHNTQIEPGFPQQCLTMGQLYDMVHSTICGREDYSVWYRVSWGKPRDSYQIEDHKEVLQLLRETNVVVAFSRGRQYYPDFDCGPWDIVSVREAFRRVVGMAMIDGHIKHEAIGDGRVTSGWQGSQGR